MDQEREGQCGWTDGKPLYYLYRRERPHSQRDTPKDGVLLLSSISIKKHLLASIISVHGYNDDI